MKILITTHYFAPRHGGIENVAYNQAQLLSRQGHDVTVVTSNLPKGVKLDANFKVIRVGALNVLEDKLGVPYPLFSPSLYRVLKREVSEADVVHAHGHVYLPSVLAARLVSRYRKPFVLTQHNTFIEYKSHLLCLVQTIADRTVGKYTLSRASKVITVSEATKTYVDGILPVNAAVQYNGIDTVRFHPTKNQESLRKQLDLPVDKIICFSVRRITFKNGIDTMIDTAKIMKDRPDILFVIGGKGPDLELARNIIKEAKLENIRLLGAVSNEDLPRYYAASDIFILPSKKGEGFPLVILEALASGVPVIATRSGGHVGLIEPSEFGYIVEPDKPDQIAARIDGLSKKPSQLTQMKKISRQFAVRGLSWEKNVADLLSVFEEATT